MLVFKAINGQSILDIILNTYGTFDLSIKLLQDNAIANINYAIVGGEKISWDNTLTADQVVNVINTNTNTIYSTVSIPNAPIKTKVQGNTGIPANNNGYYQPSNPNPATMIKYEEVSESQYIATGGETTVVLAELIGCAIVQIEKEIRPLMQSDFLFNTNTGTITLQNGIVLGQGETLFIIKSKLITS